MKSEAFNEHVNTITVISTVYGDYHFELESTGDVRAVYKGPPSYKKEAQAELMDMLHKAF